MTTLTEGQHTAEFIVSEASGKRSREVVSIGGSAAHPAGTLLHNSSGTYIPLAVTEDTPDTITDADAVLYAATDATGGAVDAVVIARDAEVNWAELVYPAAADTSDDSADLIADIKANLALAGIIVR